MDPSTPAPEPGARRSRWLPLVAAALSGPVDLDPGETAALVESLRAADRVAQSALLALQYGGSRFAPELLEAALAGLESYGGDAQPLIALFADALDGPLAEAAAATILARFAGEPPAGRPWRLDLLRQLLAWTPRSIPLPDLVAIPARVRDEERPRLLAEILEPALLRRAPELSVAQLEQLASALGEDAGWPLTLAALAAHPRASPAVRRRAAGRRALPGSTRLRRALAVEPAEMLVVQNLRMGQGDEVVRVAPVLQAFLAGFPKLEATLVTPRPHLWEHPRLRVVPLADRAAAEALCAARPAIVVDLFEPLVPQVNLAPALHERLLAADAAHPAAVRLAGDLGMTRFVFAQVRIGGEEWAERLGVATTDVDHIYDPGRRLALGLGLPWLPVAHGAPRDEADVLAGRRSPEAEALWHRLLPTPRPRVLVNPFGGAREIKGITRDRLDLFAAELAALVGEGAQALVLPTGTGWVDDTLVAALVDRLDPATRAHVRIGPDPAGPAGDAAPLALVERPELSHADRMMRIFKHFAALADRVVTVEGWLGHVAALLGRPVRLVLMPYSFGPDWYPPGAVELASTFADGAAAAVRARDRFAPSERSGVVHPLLPRRLRRIALQQCLGGLPEPLDDADVAVRLRQAAASPEPELRATAARALGRVRPLPLELLVSLAGDRFPRVGGAAAAALLEQVRRGVAVPVRESTLRAVVAIARQRWQEVIDLGAAALPALAVAARGEGEIVSEEAAIVLRAMLARRLAGGDLRRDGAQPRSRGG